MSAVVLQQRRRDRNTSVVATVVLHVLLGLLFLFVGLKQFDPPLQEEMVEVAMADYGTTETGGGDDPSVDPGGQGSAPVETNDPEEVATDEESDVEVVKPEKPKKPTTEPKPEKPKKPTLDRRLSDALNNWNKPGQESNDGPGEDPGDVGAPEGTPGGIGTMRGNGWEIRGSRGAMRGPDLSEKPVISNETWVEVAIVIDRDGNVVRRYVSNAAIQNVEIHNVALRAVKNMRFVANPGGPAEQVQYIRLTFRPG